MSVHSTLALVSTLVAVLLQPAPAAADDWPMFGQNLQNTAAADATIRDVRKLKVKWTFTTGGDVSARAAVVKGVAYFPDWGGNLWAVDADTGERVWGRQLSEYGLPANTRSRTSPAVVGGTVYIGTQEGAWLLAINARTGKLRWKTQLESAERDPHAIVTASPAVAGGVVYTGVASLEETFAGTVPGYACCKARGSVVAVDARTGKALWKTYMAPAGYSGAGVWGSNFVVDAARNSVFVSTGNNYANPTAPAYAACIAAGGDQESCNSPRNHVDAVVALNLRTGKVKWSMKGLTWEQQGVKDGSDAWNVSCLIPAFANCPGGTGPDYDFASAPNLVTFRNKKGRKTTILGAGQKSGLYFALDPDTGRELWRTQVGPGSTLGGMEWGSASDGKRIYVAIANLNGLPTPVGGAGSWSALDPETGKILWQVGDPNGAIALGPLTVSGGVVYAASMAGAATAPTMLALSAASGQTLWSFAAGSSVVAGASVVDGVVFWGSGYAHLGIPGHTANNRFYAFSRNGR